MKKRKCALIIIAIIVVALISVYRVFHHEAEDDYSCIAAYINQINEESEIRKCTYYFLDVDNDSTPEMIQDTGEMMRIFKYDNGELVFMIDEEGSETWTYGTGALVEYNFLPEKGIILGLGGSGPPHRWMQVWRYNKKTKVFEKTHLYRADYYDDLNGNGKFDSGEEPYDGSDAGTDADYHDGDKTIFKFHYDYMMSYFYKHGIRMCDLKRYEYNVFRTDESKDEYARPELNAYEEILTEHLADMPDGFGAELIYIDEDDTYELAIIDGNSDSDGVYLYTYDDGSAIPLAIDGFPSYGRYGELFYIEKENIFYFGYSGETRDSSYDNFFSFNIKDKKTVPYCALTKESIGEDKIVYKNFGKEITADEYESFYIKFTPNRKIGDYRCSKLSSEQEMKTFLSEYETDKEYTAAEVDRMELFNSFCEGTIQAEYTDADGKKQYMDGGDFDFNNHDDVTLMASLADPEDIDNDGEDEFIIQNPVYGNWYFDCKDGKVICFAWPEGTAGRCFHQKYNNANWVVHSDVDSAERSGYWFDKYNGDLEIVDSFSFRWEEVDGIERYYINNQEVSQGEYEELKNKVFAEE